MNKLDTINKVFEGYEIRSIWNDLKNKLKHEGSKLSEKTGQLKLKSTKDGKYYLIDVLDTKGILRIIESILSPKAEPFKL